MNLLVTGGTGFIGKHVIDALSGRNNNVFILSNEDDSVAMYPFSKRVTFLPCDVSSGGDVRKVFSSLAIEKVLHLAYEMDIWGHNPTRSVQVNIVGFQNILNACLEYGIKRMVWTSSVMVYGPPDGEDSSYPITEDHRLNPTTFYGKCKAFCESLATHYSEHYGLDIITLRPTTVYGAGRHVRGAATFLYDAVYAAVSGEKTNVEDSESDLVHVSDVSEACINALNVGGTIHKVFNISGDQLTLQKLLSIMRSTGVERIPVEIMPSRTQLFPSRVNRDRAQHEINYVPQIELESGLRDYIASFNPKSLPTR